MASGPYINIDLEGDLQMKDACEATAAGLRVSGLKASERRWLEAAAKRCPKYEPAVYIEAMRKLASMSPDDPECLRSGRPY